MTTRSNRSIDFRPHGERLYLAFFKPYGVITQFTQPEDSEKRTLAEFKFPQDVYPVGRLDWDSEGLLLLSDDGLLNNALLNPKHQHGRTYLSQVENIPSEDAIEQLSAGVVFEGKRTLPARAGLLDGEPDLPPRTVPIRSRKNIPTCWIELTLHEGRNRQVRKMTAAVGHPTLRLVRWSIGQLSLAVLDLEPGKWQKLSPQQVMLAFQD